MKRTLGLDIGPNSIGWAIVEEAAAGTGQLVAVGVRTFPEGVDAFDTAKEASRNEQRRTARMMRRQIARRARRRRALREALIAASLWPSNADQQHAMLTLDPYALRHRALTHPLSPHEIGRVLIHLNQRRGFLSLRKADKAAKKEVDGMLKEISELEGRLAGRTLGSFLYDEQRAPREDQFRGPPRIRNQHTRRSMIETEFDHIIEAQRRFHPKLLHDSILFGRQGRKDAQRTQPPKRLPRDSTLLGEFGLHGLIFFQRPIYWPASLIGRCELEKGERRCHRSDRSAQLFRIYQEVNNLRFIHPATNAETALSPEQRQLLVEELLLREKLDFSVIRHRLGLIDSVKFNLERGERSSLKGHVTDHRIASSKVLGKEWRRRPESEKDAIVRLLLDPGVADADMAATLAGKFGLINEEIEKLTSIDFGTGYARLSAKAIQKLLPHLKRGLPYQAQADSDGSALHAAGYLRRDELARRLFDKLPTLEQIWSGPLAELNNPVVRVALHELRRVVNSIVREFGKPDEIHIELARSLKMGQEQRAKYSKRIREIETERADIAQIIREAGFYLSRENIQRYQLWIQQGKQCIYTDRAIGFHQLFTGEVDIDHILPRSRTLDDSMMNKVVAFRSANFEKSQQTPYDWLAHRDPARYEALLARAQNLPYRKRIKFVVKELKLDDFIARQLVDTGYITRMATEYLKLLLEKEHDVIGGKGELTSQLRHHWGLDTVLEELPDSPAWAAQANLRPGAKNRADHRHHAIDAVVIALTDRSRLQHLSSIRAQGGTAHTGEVLPAPWESFRESIVDRIRQVNVSHRVRRKVSGRLHEETIYGKTRNAGEFVVRKPVVDLTPSEIERIRDPEIRRIVERALSAEGVPFGRGAKPEAGSIKRALSDLFMKSKDGSRKVPIRKVRVLKRDETIRAIRKGRPDEAWVKPGSNHHLCIFEWFETNERGITKRVRDAKFVSMLEAADRIKLRQPIIQRAHPDRPDARFVMSLSSGELVLADVQGEQKLLVFKTAASTQGQIYFALASDARKSADYQKFVFNCSTLNARKVTVDPLGRMRWAND